MILCRQCFSDAEVIGIIESLNKIGTCDICHSSNVFTYDTDADIDLIDQFDELIGVYVPVETLNGQCAAPGGKLLSEELIENWGIFNQLNTTQVRELLIAVCKEKYRTCPSVFDGPVDIAAKYDSEYLAEKSILRTNQWEDFVGDLKFKNRFHTNHINTEALKEFCTFIRKRYNTGMLFYRGRISSANGFAIGDMGAPPSEKVMPGRANSLGIRCLYLADAIKTTIHEVRAGAFDYVTVGTFELQADIIVANVKSIGKISPFLPGLKCALHAINKEVLHKINIEMAKPLRRNDSPLEYTPTQYISEFIKSLEHEGSAEYAGIEYESTMNLGGHNLAIFYPELFKCVDVKTYKIDELIYQFNLVSC